MGSSFSWISDVEFKVDKVIFGPPPVKVDKVIFGPPPVKVDKVIFNNPATIIFWTDGTKTVVKCQPGDTYDEEKGFVMAYLKKLLGNDNTFNKMIKRYCIEQYLPDYLKEE